MMGLTSLTTMLRPRIVSVAIVSKWSLKEREMGMCKSSFKLLHLAYKVANLQCRYGSTDSIHTQGSSEHNHVNFETMKIILGSSSMARKRILSEMGYEFSIMTADIDEKSIRKDTPEELVMALAQAKADAIVARLRNMGKLEEDTHATLLITADTVVVYKGMVREKPTSKEEARYFIKGYSGSHAAVVGSVLVTNLATGKRKGAWERAEVYFHDIPDEIIDNLIEERVTFNVAGGLMLEHPLTSPYVEAVVGSADTVMGLSKALTEKLIAEVL
ncbi:7-methyl-GTP pyrophosphatase [Ricinus communis]|uniref:7-methyl-GTP pyrophosphatase n=1 Tax=Ricinus communis TaxID=3988 RepID=UPI00201A4126|nr:7-methyl-GTP pyrophosphatase [Ricinus communis]